MNLFNQSILFVATALIAIVIPGVVTKPSEESKPHKVDVWCPAIARKAAPAAPLLRIRTRPNAPAAKQSAKQVGTRTANAAGNRKPRMMDLGVKGKWTIVNFWATWCGTCRNETPHLQKLFTKYGPQGVAFVGVNLDNDREQMVRYITENKISWPQIVTAGGWQTPIVSEFGLPSIPAIFLVNPRGEIVEEGIRGFHDADRRVARHLTSDHD